MKLERGGDIDHQIGRLSQNSESEMGTIPAKSGKAWRGDARFRPPRADDHSGDLELTV